MARKLKILENTGIWTRLGELVDAFANGKIADFAEMVGEKETTFRTYLRESGGHTIRIITVQRIFEKFPQISPGWLITGKGSMFEGEKEKTPLASDLAEIEAYYERNKDKPIALQMGLAYIEKTGQAPHPAPDYNGSGKFRNEVRAQEGPALANDPEDEYNKKGK